MRDEIERRLGTRVILENDANAAAMGEKWLGAGRDVNDLVLLTLGTGIGGGIISCGRVLHGVLGMAGELGHMTVYPNGNPCGCGNSGCLEKHASATAITGMAHMLSLGDNLTSAEVYTLAAEGNERAQQIFHTVGTALGIALGNLINIFNFPLVSAERRRRRGLGSCSRPPCSPRWNAAPSPIAIRKPASRKQPWARRPGCSVRPICRFRQDPHRKDRSCTG